MFYNLTGKLIYMGEQTFAISCGGVGFKCSATRNTLSALNGSNGDVTVFTHLNVREDAFDIFGFSTKEELNCFHRLIGVSGVGPKVALSILSCTTPSQFTLAVVTGDEKTLTMAQGVGKKMAQRIILELKDKLTGELPAYNDSAAAVVSVGSGNKASEAAAALATLGYSQSEIGIALKGIDVEALPLEEIVRRALRAMVMQ